MQVKLAFISGDDDQNPCPSLDGDFWYNWRRFAGDREAVAQAGRNPSAPRK